VTHGCKLNYFPIGDAKGRLFGWMNTYISNGPKWKMMIPLHGWKFSHEHLASLGYIGYLFLLGFLSLFTFALSFLLDVWHGPIFFLSLLTYCSTHLFYSVSLTSFIPWTIKVWFLKILWYVCHKNNKQVSNQAFHFHGTLLCRGDGQTTCKVHVTFWSFLTYFGPHWFVIPHHWFANVSTLLQLDLIV
jgi:hypothetical protein